MVAWTDLHAELGETPGPLTFEMIRRAVEEKVAETAGLDWKRELPLLGPPDSREAKGETLAGDLAAMANSGGGLIVYGVDEVRGEHRASAGQIVPIGPVDDGVALNIRRVASSRISPRLLDLEIHHLVPDEDPDGGVLAVWVADSIDVPHLVASKRQQDFFAAPYRNGPDTERMTERQIEAAYRTRLLGREARIRDRDHRWADLLEDLEHLADASDLAWVVLLAVPVTQPPARTPNWSSIQTAVNQVAEERSRGPRPWGALPTIAALGRAVPGHRSRVWQRVSEETGAQVSVAADGTLTLAVARGGEDYRSLVTEETDMPVFLDDVEGLCRDLRLLFPALTRDHVVRGDYQVLLGLSTPRATLARGDGSVLRDRFLPVHPGRRIRRVEGYVPASTSPESVKEAMEMLLTDFYNQAGLDAPLHYSWND